MDFGRDDLGTCLMGVDGVRVFVVGDGLFGGGALGYPRGTWQCVVQIWQADTMNTRPHAPVCGGLFLFFIRARSWVQQMLQPAVYGGNSQQHSHVISVVGS